MRVVRAAGRLLLGVLAMLARPLRALRRWAVRGAGEPESSAQRPPGEPEEIIDIERTTGGEARPVAALMVVAGLAAAGFAAAYLRDLGTQILGLTIGLALAALAAAAIVAGERLAPRETAVEKRPSFDDEESPGLIADEVQRSGEGITRRRLLLGGAGAVGVGFGAAAVAPLLSLGPSHSVLRDSPWRDGVRVVDEQGQPITLSDVPQGSFTSGFAEGADPDSEASSVVVVRLSEESLQLPPERAGWAPRGVIAYSRICTHAGCAINLFRDPLYPPATPQGPALVCPCHYSTFDPADGAKVLFGPAGRPLPQLPLRIAEPSGILLAAGPFSGPVGPAWSGVREE